MTPDPTQGDSLERVESTLRAFAFMGASVHLDDFASLADRVAALAKEHAAEIVRLKTGHAAECLGLIQEAATSHAALEAQLAEMREKVRKVESRLWQIGAPLVVLSRDYETEMARARSGAHECAARLRAIAQGPSPGGGGT
jgi:hypothetical protein